ncbi:hypothetical protein N9D44_01760 [Pontimonas sp.]|nr:hypothetical protein [Pontimonas sp.]
MDPIRVAGDFEAVGLRLLDEVKIVKDKSVRSECMKCGVIVNYSYSQVKLRIKRGTGLTGCRSCFKRLDSSQTVQKMSDAGLEPLEPYQGALHPWRYRCKTCGFEGKRRFADIQMGMGCAQCGVANRVDPRRVTEEQAVADFVKVGLEPLEPYPGNTRALWKSKCMSCGKEVSPALGSVRAGQGGCKFCGKAEMASKKRRPGREVKELFAARNLELLSGYRSNRTPVEARCNRCRKVFFLLVNTVENGLGCPYCNQRRVDPNDAGEVMRSFGLEPLEPYPGTPHAKWRCRCAKCGNVVTPVWSHARHGRGICPHCSGNIVNVEQAVELMRSRGLEPLVDFPGSVKPWLCRCDNCGKETSPQYNTIYSKPKGGCKWCADKGIDYAAPSIVYLITHRELGAHKVGIAAQTSQRMNAHRREGWETYRTLDAEDGYTAKLIEDQVLAWWRNELRLPYYLAQEEMPHGGFSETVDAEEIDLPSCWEKVREAESRVASMK